MLGRLRDRRVWAHWRVATFHVPLERRLLIRIEAPGRPAQRSNGQLATGDSSGAYLTGVTAGKIAQGRGQHADGTAVGNPKDGLSAGAGTGLIERRRTGAVAVGPRVQHQNRQFVQELLKTRNKIVEDEAAAP